MKLNIPLDALLKGNEKIEEAVAAFNNDRNQKTLGGVVNAIGHEMEQGTRFLLAAVPMQAPGGNNASRPAFRMNVLKTNNGALVAAAFTSTAEQRKGGKTEALAVPIKDVFENVLRMEQLQGVVLNPWGSNFLITRQLITSILSYAEQKAKLEAMTPKERAAMLAQMAAAAQLKRREQAGTNAKPVQEGNAAGTADAKDVREKITLVRRKPVVIRITPDFAKGAVLGLAVGDALGTPVEGTNREALSKDPVTGFREGGVYGKPAGTWGDDTGMTLCAVDSLAENDTLNYGDIFERYFNWRMYGNDTADGESFGIDSTADAAVMNYARGTGPLQCGLNDQEYGGNGSLMRILPFAILLLRRNHLMNDADRYMLHQASALTHTAPESKLACELYALVIRALVLGGAEKAKEEAVQDAVDDADLYYRGALSAKEETAEDSEEDKEAMEAHREVVKDYDEIREALPVFDKLADIKAFAALPEAEIESSGRARDSLEAAVWCFLTTDNYRDCVLKAVNLGGDTDTTAALAGALAGIRYGFADIPEEWRTGVAKADEIGAKADAFQQRWLIGKQE